MACCNAVPYLLVGGSEALALAMVQSVVNACGIPAEAQPRLSDIYASQIATSKSIALSGAITRSDADNVHTLLVPACASPLHLLPGASWLLAPLRKARHCEFEEEMKDRVELTSALLRLAAAAAAWGAFSTPAAKAVLTRAVMEVFLLGSEVFLDEEVSVPLAALVAAALGDDAGEATLLPLADVERYAYWGPWHPFAKDVVESFQADSMADPSFTRCLLLLARRDFSPVFRQLVWGQLSSLLRTLAVRPPLQAEAYLFPPESSPDVLALYHNALTAPNGLRVDADVPHLYAIALHHISAHIFGQSDSNSSSSSKATQPLKSQQRKQDANGALFLTSKQRLLAELLRLDSLDTTAHLVRVGLTPARAGADGEWQLGFLKKKTEAGEGADGAGVASTAEQRRRLGVVAAVCDQFPELKGKAEELGAVLGLE